MLPVGVAGAGDAGFIGSPAMNLLTAKTSGDGTASVDGFAMPIDRAAAAQATGAITLGVRPESWRIAGPGEEGYPVKVAVVEELGADAFLYATPAEPAADAAGESGLLQQIVARIDARMPLTKGETVRLTTTPDKVHVFDTTTGARLTA